MLQNSLRFIKSLSAQNNFTGVTTVSFYSYGTSVNYACYLHATSMNNFLRR